MKIKPLLALWCTLTTLPVSAGPTGPIAGETLQQTAERTGYSAADIRKYFPAIEATVNTDGLATDRFKAPPQPGVHPRIFFNPEDLPDLRERIADTKAGQVAWKKLTEEQEKRLTGPEAVHAGVYQRLLSGASDLGEFEKEGYAIATLLAYEAFRCLIEDDAETGRDVAKAGAALARIADAALTQEKKKLAAKGEGEAENWQRIQFTVYHHNLGLIYDFAHGWMDEAQRQAFRDVISHATTDAWLQGGDSLPAWIGNTSNWITGFNKMVILTLAIEGEPGYAEPTYERCVASMHKWLNLGLLDRGAPFEGLGKNQVCAEHLVAMAKRGDLLIAYENMRAHVDDFHLHAMQPFGYGWTTLSDWGGSESAARYVDIETMKYAYPDDPTVDFVFRNAVGEDYGRMKDRNPSFAWKMHDNLMRVIFAQDFDGSKTWEQAKAAATADEPLTFFSFDRGQLFAQSDWSKDAVQLGFLPRAAPDGHTHGDRNDFMLSGLGRVFVKRVALGGQGFMGNIGESRFHSVVVIDGEGQNVGKTRPGRVVAYADGPVATVVTGDAADAYSASYSTDAKYPRDKRTPNDSRLEPSKKFPFMDLPWGELPDWYTGKKPDKPATLKPFNPVEKAFRTVAMVRGEHPYVLIADDIRKDGDAHRYDWLAQVESDLELLSMRVADTRDKKKLPASYKGPDEAYEADLILGDAQGRRLLVRVLQNDEAEDAPRYAQPGTLETYMQDARWHKPGKRVVISSHSVEPKFKVLLYPHRDGDALPVTLWNEAGTGVSVTWPDQTHQITFTNHKDGYTEVKVEGR